MLDEEFSFPTFMGDKIRLRVVRIGSDDQSLEQRARAQVAARELRLGVEWHSEPILLVVQQLSAVLRGRDPFFLPRSIDPDIHDRAFLEDLVETVERALETGRLLVVEGAFPLLAPRPELELTERERPPLELPPLPPIARPVRPDRLTFFEVRVVDEIGQAIAGLEVELKAGEAVETSNTNPAGVATLEDVTSMSGSVTVVDIEALRVIVEPRWEKTRQGSTPTGPTTKLVPFTGADIRGIALKPAVPNTLVITPPLGKLFVELRDKTGRVQHVGQAYEISGPETFSGTTDDRGRLLHEAVTRGDYELTLSLEIDPGDGTKVTDTFTSPLVVLETPDGSPQVRMLGALPRVSMARLRGLLFETNKSFLLPTAIEALQRIREIYESNHPSDVLVVGHTDTTAEPALNDQLSLERANSMKAYLEDDVSTWLDNYELAGTKCWGAREDRLMIAAMPDFGSRSADEDMVKWFQRTRELEVDGKAGTATRTQLITEYMALDGVKLSEEPEFRLNIKTHGAGENFPLKDTGFELDTKAADESEDPFDRRVELFFFDSNFGILPKPGAPNGSEYLQWRKRAEKESDFPIEGFGKKATLVELHDALFRTNSCVVLPEGETPSATKHESVTGIGLFASTLRFSEEHGPRKILIAGHTDTTATVEFNQTLSEERAKCVLAVLEGDRDLFVSLADNRHTVADYKQILSWCATTFPDFDCDPGTIDDNEFTGIAPLKRFQASYNELKTEIGASSQPDLEVDGDIGPLTWGALFDVYQFGIAQELSEDEAGIAKLRESLVFVDPNRKALGFSEHHPVDAVGRDNVRSQENRRVEVLFFEEGEEPDIDLAESDPDVSELYLPGFYVFEDVGPEQAEPSSCDDCGLLGPASFETNEANPSSELPPLLKKGDRRKSVGLLQILLNDFIAQLRTGEIQYSGATDAARLESDLEASPTFIEVDCIFGDETQGAVNLFQNWHGGIEANGVVDDATWKRLIQVTELYEELEGRPVPEFPKVGGEVDLTAVPGLSEPAPILLASNSNVIPSAGVQCARTYSRAKNFKELVTLVRDAETLLQTCGEDTPDDVLGIIRGIYYGTVWSADFSVEKSPVRNTGFNVYATGFPLPPADPRDCLQCNLFEALQASQDVVDGARHVDFGHLIIGLEARFEGEISNITLTGHSGLEAATWLGDLGGGAAMLANSRVAAPSTRAQTRFRGTNFGGSINLEGDVASYVVAKSAVTNAPSAPTFPAGTSPIADALETYLSPGTTGGPEWLGRSRAFLGMLGGTLTGNTLTNRIAVVATVQVKIEEFASYYLVNRLRQTGTLTSANLRNAAIFLNGASQEVAEIFIDALVDNVANPNQRIRAVTDPAPRGTGPIPPQCQRTIDAIEKMEAFDRLQRELKRRLGF